MAKTPIKGKDVKAGALPGNAKGGTNVIIPPTSPAVKGKAAKPPPEATGTLPLPVPVGNDSACNPCAGRGNGIVTCFDGATIVLTPPSEGIHALVWIAGVGWDWENMEGGVMRKPRGGAE